MKNSEDFIIFPTLVTRINSFLTESQCDEVFEYIKKIKIYPHSTFIGDGKSSHMSRHEKIGRAHV